MDAKNEISEELRLLSELVSGIGRQNPYRVADGYFADLPSRVMLRINALHKPMAFNVPDGYFEGFAEGLLARIKAGAGKPGALSTDPSAFTRESAASELAALSPLLAQLRPLGTYSLPEGYFEEISPLLTIAREANPYTVPEEYFHQFPSAIAESTIDQKPQQQPEVKKPAKLVAFGGRRTNWWKYSAAAVVAGLLFSIGWLRLHVTGGIHPDNRTEITAKLMKVSDQELQTFLSDQDTTLAQQTNVAVELGFNDSDVKSLLGDVPDGDLKQYLDEHGGAIDIATN
jgi:hypothetical protein